MFQALAAPIAAAVGRVAAGSVARMGGGKVAQSLAGKAGRSVTFHEFTKPENNGGDGATGSAGPVMSRDITPENVTPPTSYIG